MESGRIHHSAEIMPEAVVYFIANNPEDGQIPVLQIEVEITEKMKNLSQDKSLVDSSGEKIIEQLDSDLNEPLKGITFVWTIFENLLSESTVEEGQQNLQENVFCRYS